MSSGILKTSPASHSHEFSGQHFPGTLYLLPFLSAVPVNHSIFLGNNTLHSMFASCCWVKTRSLRSRKQKLFSVRLLILSVQNKRFLPKTCEGGPLSPGFLLSGPSHPVPELSFLFGNTEAEYIMPGDSAETEGRSQIQKLKGS